MCFVFFFLMFKMSGSSCFKWNTERLKKKKTLWLLKMNNVFLCYYCKNILKFQRFFSTKSRHCFTNNLILVHIRCPFHQSVNCTVFTVWCSLFVQQRIHVKILSENYEQNYVIRWNKLFPNLLNFHQYIESQDIHELYKLDVLRMPVVFLEIINTYCEHSTCKEF